MAISMSRQDHEPMADLNTTPLIDVMLVLLVMFIITIPIANHSLQIELPTSELPIVNTPRPDPVKNKLVLTQHGEIVWNGEAINQAQLERNLSITMSYSVEPELQYEPEANASYNLSVQVLSIIKNSGASKFGFVGNHQYREFGR